MMQHFKIGSSTVDLSRNQISGEDKCETLPPKAMAVLAILAQKQGQVISTEALLTQAWPETVVSPNTLQRSITQLRKALGDDGKQQNIIVTHAKQGYSLELPVEPVEQKISDLNSVKTPSHRQLQYLVAIASGIMVVMLLGWMSINQQNAPLPFNRVINLTSTDAKESGASYSPDGHYIVFHRFAGLCANNIWAKEISTGREIQLTTQYGVYGAHAFSPDGKQMIFKARASCIDDLPVRQSQCWQLMTIDFAEALKSPQLPTLRADCGASMMNDPQWLTNGAIAVLQQNLRWHLVTYPSGSNEAIELYAPDDRQLYSMTYSPTHNRIALLALNNDGQHVLDLLDNNGQRLKTTVIDNQAPFSRMRQITLNFHPTERKLIFSGGKQIYQLSFDGQVSTIPHNSNQQIFVPTWHANKPRLLAISGIFDADIAKTTLDVTLQPKESPDFNQTATPYKSIHRSIFDDRDARFNPVDDTIAFVSARTGFHQLWLADGPDTKQLTHLPRDSFVQGFIWQKDGNGLVVAANGQLQQVDLNGDMAKLDFKFPVIHLFERHNDNELLLSAVVEGEIRLLSYNQNSKNHIDFGAINPLWAAVINENEVVYLDNQRRFHHIVESQHKAIEALDHTWSAKRFTVVDDTIFSLDKNNHLWSFNVAEKHFEKRQRLDPFVNYVSDIKDRNMLLTQLISVKKEVIELTHESSEN